MSVTSFEGRLVASVRDDDQLPQGITQRAVFKSLTDAVQAAIDAWAEENDHLVACPPDLY